MKTIFTIILCSSLFIFGNAQTIDISVVGPGSTCSGGASATLTKSGVHNSRNYYDGGLFKIIYTGGQWEIRMSNLGTPFINASTQSPNPPCLSDGGWVTNPSITCYNEILILGGSGCGASLPVELLSFKAIQNKKAVELQWQTATEINNDYFEVERSVNGKDFESIGIVEGNGNSTEINNYQFTDSEIMNGDYYYRLKQVDFDGTIEIHEIVVLEVINLENNVRIFPMLTQGRINIQSTNTEDLTVQVYSLNGQLVQSFSNPSTQINISHLPNGNYFLRIIGKDNAQNQIIVKY